MPEMPADPLMPVSDHRLRSGTAARLAGLPVTTLRVWERRYGVVGAARTGSGQRLYSQHDVSRLRLLRQLTHAGHAIGTIAALGLEALQALAHGETAPAGALPAARRGTVREAVVVGRSAAHALEAVPGCVLCAIHDDLDQAEAAPLPDRAVGLLLVRLASLQPSAVERVLALGTAMRAGSIFVVYAFGTEASARSLRDAGATVRREPLTDRDLAHWVHGTREAPAPAGTAWQVAPRRFGDEALARLAAMRSPVACECLRHMAEIVAQLAGFERYSQDCGSTGPADAALHRHLSHTAGAARTMFEQALQRVVDDEGLELPDEPTR